MQLLLWPKLIVNSFSCIEEIENETDFYSKPVIGNNSAPKTEAEQPPQNTENVPKCPSCGAPLEEDSKFCTNCGVKL